MTVGMRTLNRIRSLENALGDIGLVLGHPQYHTGDREQFGVFVMRDRLPVYNTGSQIYTGNLDEVEAWLNGWQKCGFYLQSLKVVDRKRIAKAEERLLQERTLQALQSDPNEDIGD